MERTVNPVPGLRTGGWYSPAVKVGQMVFVAGLIATDAAGKIVQGGTEAQIRRIFAEIEMALTAHGSSLQHIVKINAYFTNRKAQWPLFDRIRREIFPSDPPAATGVGVVDLAPGAEVEMDAIAVIPNP